jgi:single-strand DNA-binding protein
MADINHVVLVGRLTRNAELKYTNSGQAVSKFSIAINQRRKKDDQWTDEANFFDIVLWGKAAEAVNQYLVKGKQVGIEGQLRQNRWEQDGQPRSKVEIVASNVMLLGSRGGSQTGDESGPPPKDFPEGQPPAADNFQDDIPF